MQPFQRQHIQYLLWMADQYWAAAHMLWALRIMSPSAFNLYHAVELYLRAVWLSENQFTDEKSMQNGLRAFVRGDKKAHDIQAMLDKLSPATKSKIPPFTLINDGTSRFGDHLGFGWSGALMREVDGAIKACRTILGQQNPRSQFAIISNGSHIISRGNRAFEKAVKGILGSHRPMSPKKRHKLINRRIHAELARARKKQ
jgi:hypothetical protein